MILLISVHVLNHRQYIYSVLIAASSLFYVYIVQNKIRSKHCLESMKIIITYTKLKELKYSF